MPPHPHGKKSMRNISAVTRPQPDRPTQNSDLHEVDRLLHLIHHRNKNQHRSQKWWKWVGMLRRSIGKLLLFKGRGWMRREEERKKEHLVRWLREVVLPGAWSAFTTLVADSQFSTLGVVLIAVLARFGRMVGLPEDRRHVLGGNSDGKTLLTSSIRETGPEAGEIVQREYVEDLGKAVERRSDGDEWRVTDTFEERTAGKVSIAKQETDQPNDGDIGGIGPKGTVAKERASQQEIESRKSQPRQEKRRKKCNVIDDLFGDLV